MGLFTQKQKAFGLDLSDISLKVMYLQKTAKAYKVLGYTDHPMPKGMLVNDVIIDENALIAHIRAALKKLDFGSIDTSQVVASIPESKAFVRVIQIPKMSEEQAAAAVPSESEQYIPIPIEQTYLDWEIIGPNADVPEKMDILVTASPRDYIDNFLRVLKKAGLRPVAFEVESAAVARALVTPGAKDSSVLLIDLDTFRTSLIVVEKGSLQFTSSVPIAGDAFTQSIARALAIPNDQAEKIKREFGLDDSKEHQNVKSALIPVVDNLVTEIRNIIQFHDEHSHKPISQMVLCGGSSKLLHLSSYLYSKLTDYSQVDIILGNPWANLSAGVAPGKNPSQLGREDSLSYATAIGLAMRALQLK